MSSSEQQCTCCKALWVKFRLTKPLACDQKCSEEAEVCVIDNERQFWQGEDPDPNNQGFTVWNLECKCADQGPYVFKGKEHDVGLACLDESKPDKDRYRIVRMGYCEPEVVMVCATECIKPGDTGKQAMPQQWNSETRCWEDVPEATTVEICDCCAWLLALPGDIFKVERDDECGQAPSPCYRPSFPYGLTRQVKITEQIDCGECGEVTILYGGANFSCGYGAESSCKIKACNMSNRKLACDAQKEYATLHIAPGACSTSMPECIAWLVPSARPLRARATLTAKMCEDTQTAGISGISYLDVCDWTPKQEPNSAKNPNHLLGCNTDSVELGWNDDDCAWEVVNVQPHVFDHMVTDVYCEDDGCNVMKTWTEKKVAVQQCEECGDTEPIIAVPGYEVTVTSFEGLDCEGSSDDCTGTGVNLTEVTFCSICKQPTESSSSLSLINIEVPTQPSPEDFSCSGPEGTGSGAGSCQAKLPTQKYCVFGCSMGSGGGINLPVTMVEVVDDTWFRQDGLSLKLDSCRIAICVFCADLDERCEMDVVEGTDCEEGTGTGTGTGGTPDCCEETECTGNEDAYWHDLGNGSFECGCAEFIPASMDWGWC